MGTFTIAGVFFIVVALLLLAYSARLEEQTDNISDKLKWTYVLLVFLGIFLIVMDIADLMFPFR